MGARWILSAIKLKLKNKLIECLGALSNWSAWELLKKSKLILRLGARSNLSNKSQIISKGFLMSSISSKKRTKELTLLLWYLKLTCFRSFFRNYLTFSLSLKSKISADKFWHLHILSFIIFGHICCNKSRLDLSFLLLLQTWFHPIAQG